MSNELLRKVVDVTRANMTLLEKIGDKSQSAPVSLDVKLWSHLLATQSITMEVAAALLAKYV